MKGLICRFGLSAFALLFAVFGTGCFSSSLYTAEVHVKDYGETIATEKRYRLVECMDWRTAKYATDLARARQLRTTANKLQRKLEHFYPNVFASNGIPFAIDVAQGPFDVQLQARWWMPLTGVPNVFATLCSIGVFPMFFWECTSTQCQITKINGMGVNETIEMELFKRGTGSSLPWGKLYGLWDGKTEKVMNGRSFVSSYAIDNNAAGYYGHKETNIKAMAYGIASKLKEHEEKTRLGGGAKEGR